MKINLVDLVIVGSAVLFGLSGYYHGFVRVFLDIVTLVLSFFVSIKTYVYLAQFIEKYGASSDFATVISFFIVWGIGEILLYLLIQLFYPKLPEKIRKSLANRVLGVVPAFLKGLVILAVFLLIITSLPLTTQAKNMLDSSYLGKPLASKVSFLESYIQNIFKDVIKPTEFTIIKPGSDEFVELGYKVDNGAVDGESEEKMLELLNKEREVNGLKPLVMDKSIQKVARKHSNDMFKQGYFSHTNREKLSPFDRLEAGGIKYLSAGENLALAPDVYIAHKGLMESPGHRANILTPEFRKIGIGVIDGGRYGKMFTQNFTD